MKKNGKYCNGKKGASMKPLAILLALTLLVGCAIGGTIAWLTAQGGEVKNTFTVGDINITLTEEAGGTAKEFKMVPGHTITKDPIVTLKAKSEPCWLFVEVTEDLGSWNGLKIDDKNATFKDYLNYEMADGWTLVEGTINVYARKVTTIPTTDTPYQVIKNNTVTVGTTVDKAMMAKIDGVDASGSAVTTEKEPTLTFKAYAVQLYSASNNVEFSAKDAWAKVSS